MPFAPRRYRPALLLLAAAFIGNGARAETPPLPFPADAVAALEAAARASHSDAVVVLHRGEPVIEWYFGEEKRPIELMSVVKSVAALGIGRLLETGQLDSIDQPVHSLFPEWNQGRKKEITLRHLLNHTSGLQNDPNAGAEIYPSPDAIQLALAAELSEDPGSAFRYNNKATNLLAGVIHQASGSRMDLFLGAELFRPLGIDEAQWYFDPSGNPHAMAGLRLHAGDLARLGQLVLQRGMWEGERLIGEAYLDEMLAQGQPYYATCGLLWWRLPEETRYVLDEARLKELEEGRVAAEDLAALRALVGRKIDSREERLAALAEVFGKEWQRILAERFDSTQGDPIFRREHGEIVAYFGDGYLGQTLMVVPEHDLVAVRQVHNDEDYDAQTDGFPRFKELVLALVADGER